MEFALIERQVMREGKHHRELGKFGDLQAHAPKADPAAGSIYFNPDAGNQDEQQGD